MGCQHAVNGYCGISTALAGLPVLIDDKACAVCMSNKSPMTLNSVTCSRAISAQRKSGKLIDTGLIACVQEGIADGPGTELKLILDKKIKALSVIPGLVRPIDEKTCGCDALRVDMNTWGVDGCIERKEFIIDKVLANSHKMFSFAACLPMRQIISRLFDKAIKNARRKSVSNKSRNSK